jgi:two-component system cell cycle response regulator
VLVVEPSSSECSRLCDILTAGEMEVYPAADLISAVHACATFQPNLILAQMRLPTDDGLSLLRRVRQDHSTRFVPVILYGDATTSAERIAALDSGALDLIVQPIVSTELIARVRAALRTWHTLSILDQKAHQDHLTGLANRSVLEGHLLRAWHSYKRHGNPLAVVVLDLDHFKAINDTFGHPTGDEVLRNAARLLASSVRGSDLVARYGGEEFVVVALDCPVTIAVSLAERFRARLAEHTISARGIDIAITVSAGIAMADRDRQNHPTDLLRQADEALYQAKRSGRNAVCVHAPNGRKCDEAVKLPPNPRPGATFDSVPHGKRMGVTRLRHSRDLTT